MFNRAIATWLVTCPASVKILVEAQYCVVIFLAELRLALCLSFIVQPAGG